MGTVPGNALTVAAMRAVLGEVLTQEAYERMIARAAELAADARRVIARHRLAWHVTQVGARCEILFAPEPPRNGAQSTAMWQGGLETWLHASHLNEGVPVTPFHTMFLMCPAAGEAEIATHEAVFARFVETAITQGAVGP